MMTRTGSGRPPLATAPSSSSTSARVSASSTSTSAVPAVAGGGGHRVRAQARPGPAARPALGRRAGRPRRWPGSVLPAPAPPSTSHSGPVAVAGTRRPSPRSPAHVDPAPAHVAVGQTRTRPLAGTGTTAERHASCLPAQRPRRAIVRRVARATSTATSRVTTCGTRLGQVADSQPVASAGDQQRPDADAVPDERDDRVAGDEPQQPGDRGVRHDEADDDARRPSAAQPTRAVISSRSVTASRMPAAVSAGMPRKNDSRVAVTRSMSRSSRPRSWRPTATRRARARSTGPGR